MSSLQAPCSIRMRKETTMPKMTVEMMSLEFRFRVWDLGFRV